jgi:pimeloyl-ACP methyl ester carboxylesterase
VEGLSSAVIKFMDAKKIASANLVGHSLGGGIALYLAGTRPDRVKKIILLAPFAYHAKLTGMMRRMKVPFLGEVMLSLINKPVMKRSLFPTYYRREDVSDQVVEDFVAPLHTVGGKRSALKVLRSINSADVDKVIRKITAPALVVWGSNDNLLPVANGYRLKKEMKEASLLTFAQCGHMPHQERTDQTNQAILQFLLK